MITLGRHKIGRGQKPFVIAECCNNFQGSMPIAREMIEEAARCGADAVKFQYPRIAPRTPNLTITQLKTLADDARQAGLVFLCTAYDPQGVDEIDHLVDAHKIGSAEATDLDFVSHVGSKGKPAFISTGACSYEDVLNADVEFSLPDDNLPAVLMQCTSVYPTPPRLTALGVMETLREFSHYVGYSDHTGIAAYPIAAMALGADVIEVHFTLSRSLPGPDQVCSHEPNELFEICQFAAWRNVMLDTSKEVFAEEMEKISKFRKARAS